MATHPSTGPSPTTTGPGPVPAAHWLPSLYGRMHAGDLEALRAVATPNYHLRIPELGVDIAGLDSVLAWLRAQKTHDEPHHVQSVVDLGSFVVATLVVERGEPTELCHVFTRSGEGLAACCVISGTALG